MSRALNQGPLNPPAAIPRAENTPPISVKVTALPATMKIGLSLCPIDPASMGGRIGIMQGVVTVSTPARNAKNKVGSAMETTTLNLSESP